jgi:hypothetical protein
MNSVMQLRASRRRGRQVVLFAPDPTVKTGLVRASSMIPSKLPFRLSVPSGRLLRSLIAVATAVTIGWGGVLHAANQSV